MSVSSVPSPFRNYYCNFTPFTTQSPLFYGIFVAGCIKCIKCTLVSYHAALLHKTPRNMAYRNRLLPNRATLLPLVYQVYLVYLVSRLPYLYLYLCIYDTLDKAVFSAILPMRSLASRYSEKATTPRLPGCSAWAAYKPVVPAKGLWGHWATLGALWRLLLQPYIRLIGMTNVVSKLGSKKHKQAVNRAKSKSKRNQDQAPNSEITRLNKVGDRRGMTDSARPQHFKPGNPWRFKPGQSGNPNGAPKTLSGAYRKWLEQDDPNSGMTNAMLIAESAGEDAINGDNAARREIRQATEGDIVRWGDKELLDYILGDSSPALLPTIEETDAGTDSQPNEGSFASNSRGQTAGLADTPTGN